MPNPHHTFHNNTPGNWYVDDQCICCGLCENVAPETFRMSDDGGNFLVYRQPGTPGEIADAENARERCPVEAIGNDRVREQMSQALPEGWKKAPTRSCPGSV